MEERLAILIIEDEPALAEAIRMILEESGYAASVALNGRDGFDQFSRQPFAMIILDLRLPDISGLEVLREARHAIATQKVVMITAFGKPEFVNAALSAGALEVLIKPFSPEDLLSCLTRHIQQSKAARNVTP